MKKFFTLIIAVMASITFAKATVVSGQCGTNLTWTLDTNDSTLTIEGGGSMYDWSPYTAEGAPWKNHNVYIRYVSLPDGLVNIGDAAFRSCSKILSIEIPNTVTKIGQSAFEECYSLQSINIPENVASIKQGAFMNCSKLTSIKVPNSVKSLGKQAFWGCNAIEYISIGNNVSYIEGSTFYGCRMLKKLKLGNGIKSIAYEAFREGSSPDTLVVYATTPPNCGSGCGISRNAILYVRKSCIDDYKNTIWWEEFSNIYPIDNTTISVRFVDWDGTLLIAEDIEEGSAATPPADPTREGYTFIGWDKDFSNVTEDMTITAQYKINRYKVDFVDWNETVIKSDSVDWNTSAVAPSNPSRKGYTFSGWDKDFSAVKSDMIVKAQYTINYYQVVYLDYNGTMLKRSDIAYGSTAIAPANPSRDGYVFVGWSPDYTTIEEETYFVAQYEAEKPEGIKVTYIDYDDSILSTEEIVLHLPETPNHQEREFIGWYTVNTNIEEGLVIQATYKDDAQNISSPMSEEQTHKMIEDGQILILRGEKVYTVTGQEVR